MSTLTLVAPPPEHQDLDRSNLTNVRRIVILLTRGWILQRGRGPRQHDHCNWCRGEIKDDCEILVHENGTCRNAWPVSCILDWLEMELKQVQKNGRSLLPKKIRCPMCREAVFRTGPHDLHDCLEFYPNSTSLQIYSPSPALIKFVPFSPDYILRSLVQNKRSVIFLNHREMSPFKIALFAREQETLLAYMAVGRARITGAPFVRMPLNSGLAFNDIAVGGWFLVDLGNNIFLACTFVLEDLVKVFTKALEVGAGVRVLSAKTFNREAQDRGGFAAVLNGFNSSKKVEELKKLRDEGEEFMCGVHGERSNQTQTAYFHLFAALIGVRTFEGASNARLKSFLKQMNTDSLAEMEATAMYHLLTKVPIPNGWRVLSSTKIVALPDTTNEELTTFFKLVRKNNLGLGLVVKMGEGGRYRYCDEHFNQAWKAYYNKLNGITEGGMGAALDETEDLIKGLEQADEEEIEDETDDKVEGDLMIDGLHFLAELLDNPSINPITTKVEAKTEKKGQMQGNIEHNKAAKWALASIGEDDTGPEAKGQSETDAHAVNAGCQSEGEYVPPKVQPEKPSKSL